MRGIYVVIGATQHSATSKHRISMRTRAETTFKNAKYDKRTLSAGSNVEIENGDEIDICGYRYIIIICGGISDITEMLENTLSLSPGTQSVATSYATEPERDHGMPTAVIPDTFGHLEKHMDVLAPTGYVCVAKESGTSKLYMVKFCRSLDKVETGRIGDDGKKLILHALGEVNVKSISGGPAAAHELAKGIIMRPIYNITLKDFAAQQPKQNSEFWTPYIYQLLRPLDHLQKRTWCTVKSTRTISASTRTRR
ncbi:hypothetical protein LTR10_011156 [Elasticomyces elasticus]|nr:hypothetical protein LTR10_011156 [Elasticomyces elasticus]KAK4966423.1 hypothetical protein LTR42_011586 [Elasticomyces elasticus]